MPLVALPQDNTARLWLDYTVAGRARSIQFRRPTSLDFANVLSSFRQVLVANITAFYASTVFTAARYAEAGSNVTNPLFFTSLTGTGSGLQAAQDTPRFLSWAGRDASGHKVRYYLYGTKLAEGVPGDYRYTTGESTAVTALKTDLFDFLDELGVCTINGQAPTMNDYTNTGFNSYHQRALRS